jgi:hypothetical protein
MKKTVFWDDTVALVRTNVLEENMASIIRVERISKLGRMLAATSSCLLVVTANVVPNSLILAFLMTEAICSSETSVLLKFLFCLLALHCGLTRSTVHPGALLLK